MAKRRQGIHDIQAALLSHTQYIGGADGTPEPEAETSAVEEPIASPPPEGMVQLEEEAYRKLCALARYQQTTVEALVSLAVEDLLALRHRQLKAALEEA